MHILHYFLTTNTFCHSIHHLTLATLPPYNTVITYHNINPLISILTLRGTLHCWYCQNGQLAAKFQRNSILKSVKYSRTFMQVTFYKDILQHKLTILVYSNGFRQWTSLSCRRRHFHHLQKLRTNMVWSARADMVLSR